MLPHRNNVAFHPKSTTNNKLNLATYRISLCLAFYVRCMANLSLHFISNATQAVFGPLFWKCATHFFIPLVQFIMFFMFASRVQWFLWTSYQTSTLRTKRCLFLSFGISSETIENGRMSNTFRASLAFLWSRSTQNAANKLFLLII